MTFSKIKYLPRLLYKNNSNYNRYNVILSKNISSASNLPKEEKVVVGKWNINYVKVGSGPHNIVCVPGALGTIWSDMKPQIEGLNKEKFTIIALDPPGYGKSRPPEKEFTTDFYYKDADIIYEFMKKLQISKYSLLGWSDGGIIGLILAAQHPKVMEKLVVWGANSLILPQEIGFYQKTKDIKNWSPKMRQPMIDVYGEELFASYWVKWNDAVEKLYNENNGDICSKLLTKIQCPTFILHGNKDPMVDNSHVSHLHTNIQGSRIHLYPDGKHNIHLRYAEDFNKRVQDFLLLPS